MSDAKPFDPFIGQRVRIKGNHYHAGSEGIFLGYETVILGQVEMGPRPKIMLQPSGREVYILRLNEWGPATEGE